eukprot:TRINITY_DN11231_c0_g1_i1.p1 TRINITY_DN11231_c0_g1~~TRINITY_DN11231_c0_g1_i1.p1  ORF type:complete len:245 (+),score=40.24 TRINITY_DN11231_c0_g1_i1:377-1111(+)
MSQQGTVKTWKKSHGFVQSDGGDVVYIHQSEIPECRLKVGELCYFDTVTVEGHGGRVKGVNVSGPAVVLQNEVPTKEEREAEQREWKEFVREKIAPLAGEKPHADRPSRKGGKGKGGAKGTRGSKGGTKGGRIAGKGGKGARRIPKAEPIEEKRIDPADGQEYTKKGFFACYGGTKEWEAAAPKAVPAVPVGRGRGRGGPPRRIDPADGASYTMEEFKACYGGLREWQRAAAYNPYGERGRGAR